MKLNKRIVATMGSVIALSGIASTTMLSSPTPKKIGADTSPIVAQIDNHEKRITNLEGDVSVLKTNDATGTTPSVTPATESIPVVSTPPAQALVTSPADVVATPITVTSYQEIVIDTSHSDCEYTYSDNSKYQFNWKQVNEQGSWQTDGTGNNGHWVGTTNYNGYCDSRVLGLTK